MDGVTQQNAAMVEQATAAARSLASDADNMNRQIAGFHIGEPSVRRLTVHTSPQPVQAAAPRPRSLGNLALKDDWSAF